MVRLTSEQALRFTAFSTLGLQRCSRPTAPHDKGTRRATHRAGCGATRARVHYMASQAGVKVIARLLLLRRRIIRRRRGGVRRLTGRRNHHLHARDDRYEQRSRSERPSPKSPQNRINTTASRSEDQGARAVSAH